ncbi:VOC family protein [Aureimonas psammosilenae]|uniref:VOC family protein n=1 Tax=Aureimonas psammosilenae TaxID=2495496 RepID=UPI00186A433A|nr:VOC family protein [Aureimonas psammosilenae]
MERARDLDHVVLAVEDLARSRRVFEGLGFRVAADAAHPFGTGNACIFFADGSYIEPLAVLDRDLAETRAGEGNAFVRRDLSYRLRHSLPAFTAAALKSDNAAADREAFRTAGFDGGETLEFGRPFQTPGGKSVDLSFRLAFAADPQAPATFLFSCERLSDFSPDREALTRHPNGAYGISRLIYVAAEPERHRAFFEAILAGQDIIANGLGSSMSIGGRVVEVVTPEGLGARYGVSAYDGAGLHLVGVVLQGIRTEEVPAFARSAGLPCEDVMGRHVVSLSESGGCFLAFEPAGR